MVTSAAISTTRLRPGALHATGGAIGAVAAGVLPVGYLGLRGGGYDPLVHTEVGIAVWWILLLGAAVGVLPVVRLGRAAWIGGGLLAAFAAWVALSMAWSDSPDGALAEATRVTVYAGVLIVAVATLRDGRQLRYLLGGVAAGIVAVAGVALASRVWPESVPAVHASVPFVLSRRLAYPLNYWNGLAALCAVGIPLLLGLTRGARTLAGQAAAAAPIPLLGLVIYLTQSRGGAIAGLIALLVFALATSDRLAAAATSLAGIGGAALLAGIAHQHHDIAHVVAGARGLMLAATLVVCAGTALLQLAISLVVRHVERPAILRPSPRRLALGGAAVALVVVLIAGALGAPGSLGDRWREFKAPITATTFSDLRHGGLIGRLGSSSGEGRYQMWQAAKAEFDTAPLVGRGAGSFQYWWAQHRDRNSLFVRDAHSLYMETLGDTGLIGLVLLGGFFGFLLVRGLTGLVRRRVADRPLTAAAVAGLLAFCLSAAVDWVWQLPAVAVAAVICGAALLAPRDDAAAAVPWRSRLALGVPAVAALCLLCVALTGTSAIRASRADANAGKLVRSARSAGTAAAAQPFASSPRLQLALLLERAGAYDLAARYARRAVAAEPRDWEGWLVSSRIEAERGRAAVAVTDYRRARSLNPRSGVFEHSG